MVDSVQVFHILTDCLLVHIETENRNLCHGFETLSGRSVGVTIGLLPCTGFPGGFLGSSSGKGEPDSCYSILTRTIILFFKVFFFFEIILDLQKTCKLSRGSFYIPFSHVSLLSCNHSQFLGLSLFFVTFTVLRRACHMFCRMSFNWGFPIIRLKFWIWRRTQHR